ncbi:MAG TPA: class I SAM-dependent methyltransferase [Ktedonobacteraceae bacterium]|jgi:SAM-dependent methyltransferase|nr:class I SAM-dependent methyltransferase [Ktedonobacteraceae bacterium]
MALDKKAQAGQRVRELAQRMLPTGDIAGLFDAVYATANGDASGVPWADLQPHPVSLAWLQQHNVLGHKRRALVVGCGLGDDAEDLAGRGFVVTAFDVSPTAIAWCQRRFPASSVNYQVADLFNAPSAWQQAFDLVQEIYTIQALPVTMRRQAIEHIASFVAPDGQLLIVCRGREPQDDPGTMPWPLTRADLDIFQQSGLHEESFEDIRSEDARHFRVVYRR